MFTKLLAVIVFVTAVGAALLALRQQRLESMHDMATLHGQMDQDRQATWDCQVRLAEAVEPARLREAIERAQLKLQPLPPDDPPLTGLLTAANIDHDRP